MCGISVFIDKSERAKDETIIKMLKSIQHRGPDDIQYTIKGNVVMGCVRLAMIELSDRGRQPMTDESGRWTIVFNGELFNHMALRARLPVDTWKGNSDTETLLRGIIHEGPGFIKQCDGFFAFALLDLQKEHLYVYRDRYGVKPVYIGRNGGNIWIASEQKAIIAGGFQPKPHAAALRHCINYHWVNGQNTVLQGVTRLLPGTMLSIPLKTLACEEETWYAPQCDIDLEQRALFSEKSRSQQQKQLNQLLVEAVNSRLGSDAPIGTLCSGGLDSSLVTVIAARSSGQKRPAFCATFPEFPEDDEGSWAKLVCDLAGVEYIPVPITESAWKDNFVSAVYHFEYPLVHESSVALSLIAKAANALQVKALLTGEAADELFGGYNSRHVLKRRRFQDTISTEGRINSILSNGKVSYFQPSTAYERQVLAELETAYQSGFSKRDKLEAAIVSDMRCFLPHGLNRLDKNMMQHSIEIREPFLSNDMIKFAYNIPIESKVLPNVKGLLLDVAASWLPEAIIHRPKIGFNFPSWSYFSSGNPALLTHGVLADAAQIPRPEWLNMVKQANGRFLMRLWSAEIWCRLFVCNESVNKVTEYLWQ